MEAGFPEKLFYKIGEVADIASLRPSILRYWETEFSSLQPNKSRTGQRLYSKKDLETVLEIKRLLYSEKLTIEGARRILTKRGKGKEAAEASADPSSAQLLQIIRDVRDDLQRMRDML